MSVFKFLHKQVTVARVYGIPVRVDYRWFLIFALSVWLIAASLQRGTLGIGTMRIPPVDVATAWALGIITAIAYFLSVFGHELSHALMGRAEGIEIEEIVLHPFGGLARLRREPDSPRAEFRIAIAGPVASFLFSVLAFGAMSVAGLWNYRSTALIFFFIGAANLLLAIFNLVPGYPLDGGRVLRALLWRRNGNIAEATRIAGLSGQVIACTMIVLGIYMLIAWRDWAYGWILGLWSILVGLFLLDAAIIVVRHARTHMPRTVAEAMRAPFAIEPDVLISRFVDEILPLHRQTSFLVAQSGRLHGIMTLEDLKSLPRERWREKRARDVMRPVNQTLFVAPSTPISRADELMRDNGAGALAVIDGTGALVGFLQKSKR